MFPWSRSDSVDRTGGTGQNEQDGQTQHLALYKFDSCPYCRMVFRAVDRLDVNIEYRDVRTDRAWRTDLMQRTGRTQVPCLLIDDEPLFESADIVAFLTENYPAKQ